MTTAMPKKLASRASRTTSPSRLHVLKQHQRIFKAYLSTSWLIVVATKPGNSPAISRVFWRRRPADSVAAQQDIFIRT